MLAHNVVPVPGQAVSGIPIKLSDGSSALLTPAPPSATMVSSGAQTVSVNGLGGGVGVGVGSVKPMGIAQPLALTSGANNKKVAATNTSTAAVAPMMMSSNSGNKHDLPQDFRIKLEPKSEEDSDMEENDDDDEEEEGFVKKRKENQGEDEKPSVSSLTLSSSSSSSKLSTSTTTSTTKTTGTSPLPYGVATKLDGLIKSENLNDSLNLPIPVQEANKTPEENISAPFVLKPLKQDEGAPGVKVGGSKVSGSGGAMTLLPPMKKVGVPEKRERDETWKTYLIRWVLPLVFFLLNWKMTIIHVLIVNPKMNAC
jgi:hypothetical protein